MPKYDKPLDEDERGETATKYRLPFALCKERGIHLPQHATPRDAWNALKGFDINPDAEYKKMYNRIYQRERRKENKKRKEQSFDPEHSPDYKYIPEKDTIAGVKKGEAMSFEQANGGAPNPLFQRDARFGGDLYGYTTNCQTCVVAFEARQRGWDVRALPNNRNPYIKDLAYRTNLAYLDADGNNPAYKTPRKGEKKIDFIEKTIKDGRYTLEFAHGKGSSGHIVSVQRINGEVVMYDPQVGERIKDIKEYLSNKTSLKILRVDNCDFDPQYVNYILKGAQDGK